MSRLVAAEPDPVVVRMRSTIVSTSATVSVAASAGGDAGGHAEGGGPDPDASLRERAREVRDPRAQLVRTQGADDLRERVAFRVAAAGRGDGGGRLDQAVELHGTAPVERPPAVVP